MVVSFNPLFLENQCHGHNDFVLHDLDIVLRDLDSVLRDLDFVFVYH
jgi:hypothetical protein